MVEVGLKRRQDEFLRGTFCRKVVYRGGAGEEEYRGEIVGDIEDVEHVKGDSVSIIWGWGLGWRRCEVNQTKMAPPTSHPWS